MYSNRAQVSHFDLGIIYQLLTKIELNHPKVAIFPLKVGL